MIKLTLKIMQRNALKNGLILLQFVFAFVAIYMLMTESIKMVKALSLDVGYKSENLIGAQVSKLWDITTEEQFNMNYSKLSAVYEELKELEFAETAGIMWAYPLAPFSRSSQNYQINYASPEAVETLGLEIVAGRNFNAEDAFSTNDGEVLINEVAYKRYLEKYGRDVIGENLQKLEAQSDTVEITDVLKIVGVYKDFYMQGRYRNSYDQTYIAASRFENKEYYKDNFSFLSRSQSFVVKTNGSIPLAKAIKSVSNILERHFPDRSVYARSIAQEEARQAIAPRRSFLTLLFICLVLTFLISIGIVALTKENLSKRIKEIGIRMALGSTEKQITTAFLSELILLCLVASMLGSALVFALNELNILRFTIRWNEFVFSTLTLVTLSICSIILPIVKTSKTRPNVALHYE